MSRTSRTKDLGEELRLLFDQNVSEVEAYEQMMDDSRFDNVRLSKISTLYQQFRSQQEKKSKRKKLVTATALIQRSEQLAYFQSGVEKCDHKETDCFKFWTGHTSDGRFFIVPDRMPIKESASNSILKDVISNKVCRISIPTIQTVKNYDFWSLTGDIGLLTEYAECDDGDTTAKLSLSLLEFDWFDKSIEKVTTLSFEDQQRRFSFQLVTVDCMDPTRFLLQTYHGDYSNTFKLGHIQNSKLLFGEEMLSTDLEIGIGLRSLVGNTLHSFNNWDLFEFEFNELFIYVTQLDQDVQTLEVKLSPLPDHFTTVKGETDIVGEIAMDRFCLAVQHKETKRYGVVWTSHETRTWEAINFDISQPITSIEFIIDSRILLIQANDYETELASDVHKVQSKFYRIPLKKPEKLSLLAWSALVRSKSKLNAIDPYEEARKYLPYNSNIQCPFE